MFSCSRHLKNKPLLLVVALGVSAFLLVPKLGLAQSANRLKAIELVKEAATAFERGELPLTIRICRQAISLDPSYPRAYTWLGAASQRRGDRTTACNAFARVVKLAPKTPDATRAARGIKELGCGTTSNSNSGIATVPAAPISARLQTRWNATAGVTSLAFSPDGNHLSGGGVDGSWRLWNPQNGELEKLERGDAIEGSAVANGRDFYAMGTGQGNVYLFDGRDGRKSGKLEARSGSVSGLAYSPNSRFLAVAGSDRQIKIYDARGESLIESIPDEDKSLLGLAFSPDSRFLAVGFGSTVRIYSTSSWNVSRTLSGDNFPVSAVAWSRGGTLLAASSGYKIRVWNSLNGTLVRTLAGHRLTVSSLAFGNGPLLASGGFDAQVRLWNASNGASAGNLAFHNGQIRGLAFDGSGKRLASGDQNGNVAIWRLP